MSKNLSELSGRKGLETNLFEELGIAGVTPDLYAKLKSGEDAIKAAKAEIDALKSEINVPNVDIPLPAIPFKF